MRTRGPNFWSKRVWVYVHIHMCTRIYTHIYMYIHTDICDQEQNVYLVVCISVCTYIYVHVYTHI